MAQKKGRGESGGRMEGSHIRRSTWKKSPENSYFLPLYIYAKPNTTWAVVVSYSCRTAVYMMTIN